MNEQEPTSQGPAQELRFDQLVAREGDAMVQDLVKRHPELRGAAIIFDWDLPRSSIGPLPAGAWRTKDDVIEPDKCYAMQTQLARFMNHMSKTIMRMMEELTKRYRDMQPTGGGQAGQAAAPDGRTPPRAGGTPQAPQTAPANVPLPPMTETAPPPMPEPPTLRQEPMPPPELQPAPAVPEAVPEAAIPVTEPKMAPATEPAIGMPPELTELASKLAEAGAVAPVTVETLPTPAAHTAPADPAAPAAPGAMAPDAPTTIG